MKFSSGLPETKCGVGSLLANTEVVRAFLPNLLKRLGEMHPLCLLSRKLFLFDVGCGDWNWMRAVELPDFWVYSGMDDVEHMKTALAHGPSDRLFLAGDALNDEWPQADVVLCRHVLQHWSDEEIWKFLNRFNESDATFLVATRHVEKVDKKYGNFREVDLCAEPFGLPQPVEEICDCSDWLSVWMKMTS